MPNTDTTPYEPAGQHDACGANELKGLLHEIADRLADSDRRQGQMLSAMHERLETLGGEARLARRSVPAEFVPAFERVEEGMALLADKIAGAVSTIRANAQAQHAAAAPAASVAVPAAVGTQPVVMHAVVQTAAPAAAKPTVAAPSTPATSTPLESPAAAPASAPATAARAAAFDLNECVVPETEHTWDDDQAEALAQAYEAPEAGFKLAPEAPAAPAAMAAAGVAALPSSTAPAGFVAEVGRDWLESRFADIAGRIERSLKTDRPDAAFEALSRRFDELEQRFGSVLDNVATRPDVEGLRLVEAHINELAAQFEHAQAHLGRLDSIETQLQTVSELLADGFAKSVKPADIAALVSETADRAVQRLSVAREPAPDVNRIASAAAEAALTRFADIARPATPVPAVDRSFEELRGLVESLISERRSGDEQTATMLDTMQQAMIRVLDRIDAMEQSHGAPQMPAAPQEYVREQVRFGSAPAEQRPIHEDVRSAMSAAAAAAAQMPGAQGSPFSHVPSAEVPASARMSSFDQARTEKRPPSEPRVAPERSKDDFVAAARRARRQVSGQPEAGSSAAGPGPLAGEATGFAAPPAPAAPAPSLKAPLADKPAAKSQDKESGLSFFGIQRKKFLGGAVAVIAIMVASLLMPPKNTELAGTATHVETPAAVVETVEAAPVAETAEPIVQAPGAEVPAAVAGAAPTGITLQLGNTPPTPAQLEHMDRQQTMAALSSRLGEAAGGQGGTVGATPIALAPAQAAPETAPAAEAPQPGTAHHELPPATVGPLSLRLAAAKGDSSAQFEVGARLAEGKGTQQNFVEAIKWYQRSAQQGFAQSQYRLATLYERGLGVKTDLGRARIWYKRAAEQGNLKAMHNLAVLSAGRQTGAPDYATAAQWFTEAAERGLTDSQFNLAVLYESGLGVQKDLKQAFKWFSIAARKGDAQTVKRREAIRSQLSGSEMDAAETMLRDWTAKPQDVMANDARAAGEAWKQPAQQQPAVVTPSEG